MVEPRRVIKMMNRVIVCWGEVLVDAAALALGHTPIWWTGVFHLVYNAVFAAPSICGWTTHDR